MQKNKKKLIEPKLKPEIAIQLKRVTKTYELHHEKPTFFERLVKNEKKEFFTALKNVDLTIFKGEKVGIVGKNGAGKTTLLKVISRITTPNQGVVKSVGRLVSLIDLEAGFHPDLSGEENIFLNGLVIGMSKREIKEKYKEIVQFADIGQFIDAPMYTYSTGMKLRLGFAVAVFSDPDLLILDENIGAGDQDFQKKSTEKIEEFFEKGKTILVVSHWLEYLQERCERFIWIQSGKVKMEGGLEVIRKYETTHV